ncbi:hypothetical protein [Denitromonas iodatirespirans]|uniref:DUF1311 domain-containing protein n=1 Tax=Denitromonas iodatirespirans TaxID=2795389 RepID=A0A944H9Z9_DENI1|nr:hypothetical protein [Denitromonas iodatirespirans]MBT0963759.1 hypothetical protein [Denitromonas iodatirespirans]
MAPRSPLCVALLLALATTPAFALSGARAGGDYRQTPTSSDRNCARYESAIAQLDAQLARAPSGNRANQLAERKRHYQQRMREGGCGRSLR